MKTWSNGIGLSLLLALVLLVLGSGVAFSQVTPLPQPSQSQTQLIASLKDNLTQALALTQTLQQDLALRISSYQQLQASYDQLRALNEQLRQNLSDLEKQLQTAQQDLQAMKDLSARLQLSLDQASKSLESYKSETDKAVRSVVMQRDAFKYAFIAAAIVVTAETVYLVVRK